MIVHIRTGEQGPERRVPREGELGARGARRMPREVTLDAAALRTARAHPRPVQVILINKHLRL